MFTVALFGLTSTLAGSMANVLIPIPPPPGYEQVWPQAVSADGSTVVGYTARGGGQTLEVKAFRWRQSEGITLLSGDVKTYAVGVSQDGSIVVGYDENNVSLKWDANGARTIVHPNLRRAYGVSADGLMIVGAASSGRAGLVRNGVLQEIPGASVARAVSMDKSRVAGGDGRAWVWDDGVGLHYLVPSQGGSSASLCLSADGTTAGGYRGLQFGQEPKAFVWRGSDPYRDVGREVGAHSVLALSGDGQVLLGDGGSFGAFIQFGDGPPISLLQYFQSIGTQGLEGWSFLAPSAITPDAHYACGSGRLDNVITGWLFSGRLSRLQKAEPAKSAPVDPY